MGRAQRNPSYKSSVSRPTCREKSLRVSSPAGFGQVTRPTHLAGKTQNIALAMKPNQGSQPFLYNLAIAL
jgi:hypothetical protein